MAKWSMRRQRCWCGIRLIWERWTQAVQDRDRTRGATSGSRVSRRGEGIEMLTAPDLGFRRRAESGSPWPVPAVWEDPVFRGVTALAVASLLVPVLVVAILAV